MKKIYFLVLVMLFLQSINAQIAAWDFFGENSTATSAAEIYTNMDASSLLTRGPGAAVITASNSFRTTGFKNDGISTSNTDYFQCTLSAAPGYRLSLSTIDARFNGTGSYDASPGVTSQFAYSTDGINFILIGSPVTTTSLTMAQVNLSGIGTLQNLGENSTVTLRYYASGQTSTGGWGFFSGAAGLYGLAIGGSLTPVQVHTITTGTVSGPPFCVDASHQAFGSVNYTAIGNYNTTFTAWLSDAGGGFASPQSVGTASITATNPSGSISLTIPAGISSSSLYKIRVDATNPVVTGSESASFEIVNGAVNISDLNENPGTTGELISWNNPPNCFDEIMLVAKQGSGITAIPSGDGSAYIPDLDFTGTGSSFDGGKVVYKGTVSGQTITGLTNGSTYYIKAFTRKNNGWSSGMEMGFVFRGGLPVNFTDLKAVLKTGHVEIEFANATESNVAGYFIERSFDGREFVPLQQILPVNNNGDRADYHFTDLDPINGNNFYRIRADESGGSVKYSPLMRINASAPKPDITLYPNPLSGDIINLHAEKIPAGNYLLTIYGASGQVVSKRSFDCSGSSLSESIVLPLLSAGVYWIRLEGPLHWQMKFRKQ